MTRRVLFVLYEAFAATDAVGPADVFANANAISGSPLYQLEYRSPDPRPRASNGMQLACAPLGRPDPGLDMLFVPGADRPALGAALQLPRLLNFLRRQAHHSRRICSVCSGAFLLAEAGLLNGRRATTHWRGLAPLARLYPQITVESDVLYIEDGPIWSSAGVTAGIDLALALLERDHGRTLAMAVAREMVLFLVRPGGQAQFSAPLDLQHRCSKSMLSELPGWLESRLQSHVSATEMAEAMAMSERNFHRRCLSDFGATPNSLLQRLRLERARTLLQNPELPLKSVAQQAGLHDVSALCRLFRQHFGVTPGAYRSHFA
ncbi:helix-turn-helix domain-containing protein [bacterium]|nr:helix-turn-helix domain-containing protein [bacterium]